MRSCTFLLLLLFFAIAGRSQIYLDPDAPVDERVADLLSRMSLEEKIGQMTQAERNAIIASPQDIQNYYLGSVLSGGGSTPNPNTIEEWVDMYNNMQSQAMLTSLGIPLIYGVDAVHGHNNLLNAVIFPHNIGLGCTRNSELVRECARITALEVSATGLDWTFSPCIAVPQNEFWGRTYEGFGESTGLVDSLTQAAVLGFQSDSLGTENRILACAKHFVGDGGTLHGIDQGNTILPEDSLRLIHLPPYIKAMDAGVGSVMASFSSWNGEKCHGSEELLTGILKEELGFEGFVLSDWNGINQLDPDFKTAIGTAVNAGIDMAMQPYNYIEYTQLLTQLVNEGTVSMDRVDDAVERILAVKFQMGLFEEPYADMSLADTVGCEDHRGVARQAARESLVMLKNDGLLPLSKETGDILVAGSKASDVGAMCGGWSITWQGGLGEITEGTTVYEAVESVIGSERLSYTDNPNQIPEADFAIVVVGENPYAEFYGDINHTSGDGFTLSTEDKALIQSVKDEGIPMVIVLLSGRPVSIMEEINDADAFIAAWLPGTEGGEGISDVLFGDYSPTGKLSHTWPETFLDVPINIIGNNHGHQALFPYGYGLSYDDLGADELINDNTFKIFPNPVTDYLKIKSIKPMTIDVTITDITGRKVYNRKEYVEYYTKLNIEHVKQGIYLLTLTTDRRTISRKIVKN